MKKYLFFLIVSAFSTLVVAQNKLTGSVVDNKNAPLEGASVLIETAKLGVLTDANGHFELVVPDDFMDAPLTFSYIGFSSKMEFIPKNQVPLFVKLQEGLILNEVVITTSSEGINCSYPTCVLIRCFSEIVGAVPLTTEPVTVTEESSKKMTISSLYVDEMSNKLDINLTSYKNERSEMTIVNMNGQIVFQQITELLEGQNNVILSAGQLPAGMYILSVQQGKEQAIRKFVVVN